MPGMQFNLTNIYNLFSLISPFLLGFFLIMTSIFNKNLKGFIYLLGTILATFINILLVNIIKEERPQNQSLVCNLFDLPFNLNQYNSPNTSSVFIAFTIAYLLLPMITNNNINYMVVFTLLSLFIIDSVSRVYQNCASTLSVILGGLTGVIFGGLWYSLFKLTKNDSLLFFEEMTSNKLYCKKPSKQKFKCKVFKKGKLVKTL